MAKEDHATETKAAPKLQDAADTKPPKAQQEHVSMQTITDTSDNSPIGNADERDTLDILFTTVESLFECQTAEDYKATALQAMTIQSSSAALCSIPDNARHSLVIQPMMEGNSVAEDDLSQPVVKAVTKITLQAACEAAG